VQVDAGVRTAAGAGLKLAKKELLVNMVNTVGVMNALAIYP
jgi:hypothetical protein